MPLTFGWTYNSLDNLSIPYFFGQFRDSPPPIQEARAAHDTLGSNRRHSYSQRLQLSSYVGIQTALLVRPDGKTLRYSLNAGGNWVGDTDQADRLFRMTDTGGNLIGWQYVLQAGDTTETYNPAGRIVSIKNRAGFAIAMSYNANGALTGAVDDFGRALTFGYDTNGLMNLFTDAAGAPYTFEYDLDNNLFRVTYPDTKKRTYLYEGALAQFHKLTGIIDENNSRYSTYDYDGNLKAKSTEHAGGVEKYVMSYSGYSVDVTDPLNTYSSLQFSPIVGVARPASIVQVCSGAGCTGMRAQNYAYDANGNVSSRTDFNGNTSCSTFDQTRNLETARVEGTISTAACTTALTATTLATPARKTTTEWNTNWRSPRRTFEPKRLTTFTFFGDAGTTNCAPAGASTALICAKTVQETNDISGALGSGASVQDPVRTWQWTYDSYGRVLISTDPRSKSNTNTYYPNDPSQGNNRGMLNSVINAAGQTTTITSTNAHGQPLSMTDANGLVTNMSYDARQRLTSRSVGGETTNYTYDGVGQLTNVTMPDTATLSYTYDGAHRLVQVQDGLGNKVVYTLDNSGNRIKEDYVDPANALTRTRSHVYDALNRLSQDIGGGVGQITQYNYDDNGNQTSITDPLSRNTTQSYDALNRLLEVIDPVNGSAAPTKYEYDVQDNLTKVTDPKNLATNYVYNGFNELTSQISPDTGTTGFTYDAVGNMLTKTDARGVTSTYTYDALNRVGTIAHPAFGGDAAETVAYTYDTCANGKGRLCSLTDKTGTTTYSYDQHGRVIAKAQTVSGLTQTIGYHYNPAGQMDQMTLPSGKVAAYTYLNNRITGVSYNGQPVVKNADYEPFGPLGEWTWGNDSVASPNKHTRYFDLDGRNTKIESGNSIDPAIIVYDAASRITDLQKLTANAVDPAKSTTYSYDNLDRLTNVTPNAGNANPTRGFTYDGVGNRLTATLASSVTNYNYGTTSHRLNGLTGATTKTFSYDNDGNRLTDGASTWSYGGNNRPTSISIPATSVVVQAGINALGQRVTKTVYGTVTRFMYDEAGRLIGEYNNSGQALQETLWFNDLPVAVIK